MPALIENNAMGESAPAAGLRGQVLSAAKRFKSSWVELGKLLTEVRDQRLFETWGYSDFETYCLKEIRIRRQTALKLTRSFGFLDKYEASRSEDARQEVRAPSFEVVSVLAEAEARGQLSEKDYRAMREGIWDSEKSPGEVRRELEQRFPKAGEVGGADRRKKLASALSRLAEALAAERAPRAVLEAMHAAEAAVSEWVDMGKGGSA